MLSISRNAESARAACDNATTALGEEYHSCKAFLCCSKEPGCATLVPKTQVFPDTDSRLWSGV